MSRRAVTSSTGAPPIGPYSQAIVANGFVFVTGTPGIDPDTGVAPEGIEAQTEQALRNIAAILLVAGTSMASLVKTTMYYVNVDDYPTINAIYARHMPDPPPVRAGPANIRLPGNLLISIEAIAVLPADDP
jgi:2-iminobutanoate/2-iminopropanoate deaminase